MAYGFMQIWLKYGDLVKNIRCNKCDKLFCNDEAGVRLKGHWCVRKESVKPESEEDKK